MLLIWNYLSTTQIQTSYFKTRVCTGKSLSEALLFAERGENMLCTKIVLNVRNNFFTRHVLPRFELGIFMYWTCNSMNNLSSYFWLVNAKIRASDKGLPVQADFFMYLDIVNKRKNYCTPWFPRSFSSSSQKGGWARLAASQNIHIRNWLFQSSSMTPGSFQFSPDHQIQNQNQSCWYNFGHKLCRKQI